MPIPVDLNYDRAAGACLIPIIRWKYNTCRCLRDSFELDRRECDSDLIVRRHVQARAR